MDEFSRENYYNYSWYPLKNRSASVYNLVSVLPKPSYGLADQ